MVDEWALDEVFDADYEYFYGPLIDEEAADEQADLIAAVLELTPGTSVLDLACGHGRIATRLAVLGLEVTGIDASEHFIERARREARDRRVDVDFRLGDMREIGLDGAFDVVICWFTSFGYFDDDDNRRVLASAFAALRPGGRLLIELNHKDALLTMFEPQSTVTVGDDTMTDRRAYDPRTGRMHSERFIIRDGESRSTRFFVRMFSATELCDWTRAAGFVDVEACGGDGDTLTMQSRRMMVMGTKPTQ